MLGSPVQRPAGMVTSTKLLGVEPRGDARIGECRERWCHCTPSLPLVPCIACEPPTRPAHPELRLFEGTYVLRSVNEQTVPVVENVTGQLRLTLLADTLHTDGRGHYTETIATEMDSIGGAFRLTTDAPQSGEYEVRNDTVRFVVHCPMGAFCIHPMGWFEGGSFVRKYAESMAPVSRFERAPSDR